MQTGNLNEILANNNVMDQEFEQAQECIRIGERSRILFEMLLDQLGMTYENHRDEVWAKLSDTQERYNEAVRMLSEIVKARHKTVGLPKNMADAYIEMNKKDTN